MSILTSREELTVTEEIVEMTLPAGDKTVAKRPSTEMSNISAHNLLRSFECFHSAAYGCGIHKEPDTDHKAQQVWCENDG